MDGALTRSPAAGSAPLPPVRWYAALTAQPDFNDDAAQRRAVAQLERLHHELTIRPRAFLPRWLGRPRAPKGVYLWGGVGRGKSLLMDTFYRHAPLAEKRRVHFHRFMQEVHGQLGALKGMADPLEETARRMAQHARLLCLDEFHVTDIGDAMILGRLLKALLEHGVILLITSNQPPENLYANGLQRASFLPAIALLRERFEVVEVEGGQDYRLRFLARAEVYHMPGSGESDAKLAAIFERLARGEDDPPAFHLNEREIQAQRRAPGAAWFDFRELCGAPRSQPDYLQLVRAYDAILVSGIPRMTPEQGDAARRFVWLVDVCYDHHAKLILAADAAPDELYTAGPNSAEFARTASRLHEMQTEAYLAG